MPSTTALPADGTSSPPSTFMSVVLPLPLGPMMPITSPRRMVRSRPCSATTSTSSIL